MNRSWSGGGGGGGVVGWGGVQIEVPYHHRLPSAELVNQGSVLLRSAQFHLNSHVILSTESQVYPRSCAE